MAVRQQQQQRRRRAPRLGRTSTAAASSCARRGRVGAAAASRVRGRGPSLDASSRGETGAGAADEAVGVSSLTSFLSSSLSVSSPAAAASRGETVVCGAKKGKYGESYVFQVIRGDNEEDEALFRRFKRNVVSSHVLIEARRRRFFEGKIARYKRKLKMKSIERRLYSSPSVPKIMTMAQRREMEAAGRIPGYNPLTRSPFLADINPSMQRGFNTPAPAATAKQPSASDIFLGSGVEGEMDVESLFGSKLNAGDGAADPVTLFSDDDEQEKEGETETAEEVEDA